MKIRPDDEHDERPSAALVSEPMTFQLDAVRVLGAGVAGGELDAAPRALSKADRAAMIESVRAGKHVELDVQAITFRQKDGAPNRNGLRIRSSKLSKAAKSFAGKPALVDHRSWMQSARIGTIVESEAVDLGDGWTGFRQTLRVVKPEAVISVLDGTIDRFSIGWSATGPVICTAHGGPVFDACGCWPLDSVTIDGEAKIAEYEFTSVEGDETSGVNTPAVAKTKIEDVRAALAASLKPLGKAHTPMAFTRLAAALSLVALSDTDEDRAVAAVEEMKRGRLAAEAERDTYRERARVAELSVAEGKAKIAALETAELDAKISSQIEAAYTAGKLVAKRDADGKRIPSKLEAGLRGIGKTLGVEALAGQIDDLPVLVPVGQRRDELADPVLESEIASAILAATAAQLGLDPKALAQNAAALSGSRKNPVIAPAVAPVEE